MSRVYTDTIEPRKPTQDITLGTAGETITLPGNDLRVNTVKDKGGNTLWTSDGSGNVTSVNTAMQGNITLVSTQTASNSASVSFTSGIDSTYDVYCFRFTDINPATDNQNFEWQVNASGESGFNETMVSTYFRAMHFEDNSYTSLALDAARSPAQGTGYRPLMGGIGNGADEAGNGELWLFAPSSTTYGKIFYSTCSCYNGSNSADNSFTAGYINTAAAITQATFRFASGNMTAGTVKLYGLQ